MYQDLAYWKDTRLMEVVIMGHVLHDKRVKQIARNRYPKPTLKKTFFGLFEMFKVSLSSFLLQHQF